MTSDEAAKFHRLARDIVHVTACVLSKETCDRIFKHLGIDAECVKILENLLESISKEVSNKTHLAYGSPPEAEMK